MVPTSLEVGDDLKIFFQVDDTTDGADGLHVSLNYEGGGSSRRMASSWEGSGEYIFSYADLSEMWGKHVTVHVCRNKRIKVPNHPGEEDMDDHPLKLGLVTLK